MAGWRTGKDDHRRTPKALCEVRKQVEEALERTAAIIVPVVDIMMEVRSTRLALRNI